MEFLKHFNESLSDVISREDAFKRLPPINFSYRDISEVSDFFNENYPDIDYSIGKTLLNQNTLDSSLFTFQFLRFLINPDFVMDNKKRKSIFKSLNDDNVFVFSYLLEPVFMYHCSDCQRRETFAIIKTDDDYFLIFKMNNRSPNSRQGGFNFKTESFICDDIDGLIDFLENHLSSILGKLKFSDKHKMYIPLVNSYLNPFESVMIKTFDKFSEIASKIIILGAPGAGKGTFSNKLKSDFGYEIFSTGDILREMRGSNTTLGRKLQGLLGTGNFVSDEIVNEIIEEKISGVDKFILDGYPRTIKQAKFLDNLIDIDLVLYLDVEENKLIKRILERGKTSNRKDDQSIDIIEKRLEIFKRETYPIKEHYKDRVITINGNREINEVYNDISKNI